MQTIRRFQGLSVLSVFVFLSALAADGDAMEDVIKSRQQNLRDMGGAFKGINDELKKDKPMVTLIKQYAEQIDDLAQQQKHWFPAGSGPEAGVKTAAKPEIWTKPADFKKVQDALIVESAKFLQVVAGNDLDAIKAETRLLGQACGACHRPFRVKED